MPNSAEKNIFRQDVVSNARWKQMSQVFAFIALGIGVAAFVGWIFDVDVLKRVHRSLVTMKANTAICLMLAAISLLLLQKEPVSRTRRSIVQLFALIVALVGIVTFAQHLFGWDLGIDQMFFRESIEEAGQSFPGRMGVAASLNFFCLGMALLLLDAKVSGKYWLTNSFTIAPTIITSLVFLYYFYGIEQFEPIAMYATIALHTVIAFLSLCLGLLLVRPDRGIMIFFLSGDAGGIIARRMLPAAVVIPILLGWLRTLARDANLISSGFGTAIFVLLIVVIFIGLIWWTAAAVNRMERNRKKAEELRRESELKFSLLFEKAAFGAALAKLPEGVFVDINESFTKMFGYSKEEVIGKTSLELDIHPDADKRKEMVAELQHRDMILDKEVSLRTKSGELRTFLNNITVIEFGGNKYVLTTVQDISERKHAEEALRESEARFRNMADNAPVMIWMKEPDGSCSFLSQSWYDFTGQTPETGLGHGWVNAVHPEDQEHAHKTFVAANAGRKPFRAEYRLRRTDGEYRWAIDTATPRFSDTDTFLGYIGSVIDITERKHAEHALTQRVQEIETMMDVLPVGLYIAYDRECNRIVGNRAARQFLRMNADPNANLSKNAPAVVTQHFKIMKEGRELAPHELPVQVAAREGISVPAQELELIFDDGERRYELISARPLFDDNNVPRGAIASFIDITDRKEIEKKMRRLNEDLELRVEERTIELQRVNKELEAFSYSVAHDLKAPLRAISGYGGLLRQHLGDSLDAEGKHLLTAMTRNAHDMSVLIEGLLRFSHLSRMPMNSTAVDMKGLVLSAREEVEQAVPDHRAMIHIQDLPPAVGDPLLLRQIMVNLLSNAIKFTRSRKQPCIEIGSFGSNGERGYYVRDNGVGFDMQFTDKLFGVFQRLHKVEEYEGTGIGLAFSKRIIERHGGKIWAEGKVDEGATFYFTLPM